MLFVIRHTDFWGFNSSFKDEGKKQFRNYIQIKRASDRLDKRKRKEFQVLAAFYNTNTQKKDSYRN